MISGVIVKKIDIIESSEGKLMHMINCDDPNFSGFGEIYFSYIKPNVIKGWHKSKTTTKNYVVVLGNINLVLFDGKVIETLTIGEMNYCSVTIPPGVWVSFCSIDEKPAIIADLLNKKYSKEDNEKINPKDLTDYWKGIL